MKKRKIIWIAAGAVLLCALAAAWLLAGRAPQRKKSGVPDEVTEVLTAYMDAYREGIEHTADYVHFESDFIRSAFFADPDKLIDYKVESAERINDRLYAFTVLCKTEQTVLHYGEDYLRCFNFVTKIGDRWYFLNGVNHIPQENRENLDETRYVYHDDDIVPPEDVIGVILPESKSGGSQPPDFAC